MTASKLNIAPSRSVPLFAVATVAMIVVSYVIVILLAAACAYLPYLLMTSAAHQNKHTDPCTFCGWIGDLRCDALVTGLAFLLVQRKSRQKKRTTNPHSHCWPTARMWKCDYWQC